MTIWPPVRRTSGTAAPDRPTRTTPRRSQAGALVRGEAMCPSICPGDAPASAPASPRHRPGIAPASPRHLPRHPPLQRPGEPQARPKAWRPTWTALWSGKTRPTWLTWRPGPRPGPVTARRGSVPSSSSHGRTVAPRRTPCSTASDSTPCAAHEKAHGGERRTWPGAHARVEVQPCRQRLPAPERYARQLLRRPPTHPELAHGRLVERAERHERKHHSCLPAGRTPPSTAPWNTTTANSRSRASADLGSAARKRILVRIERVGSELGSTGEPPSFLSACARRVGAACVRRAVLPVRSITLPNWWWTLG